MEKKTYKKLTYDDFFKLITSICQSHARDPLPDLLKRIKEQIGYPHDDMLIIRTETIQFCVKVTLTVFLRNPGGNIIVIEV